jgi:serine/threonine protein kinase
MEAPPTDRPETLDGYRLIRLIGRGGFGEVWLCRSEAMGDYRALKWIPATESGRLEKEYESLLHYRKAAAALRSPALLSIEHVGRTGDSLYYVMPLADGATHIDPSTPRWTPLTLAEKLRQQTEASAWFSSAEVIELMTPVLDGLQILTEAGLVHRDVKPDNILFFHGHPCLGDISLLGMDAPVVTRRGTPGYAPPSWYLGGHPDMYGAAATLYSLLTGNEPDKMGRSAFHWPPQGEESLSPAERDEWKRLHGVIRRATEEAVSERFLDFKAMRTALAGRHEVASAPLRGWSKRWAAVLTLLGLAPATVAIVHYNRPTGEIAQKSPRENLSPELPELTPDQKADYQALAGMVLGYTQDGKYANALAAVEELLATYPQARAQSAYSVARAIALQGLGRIDEAKEELRKPVNLSPNITAMSTRMELWEELGELDEAENDLTRVLDKYGPATFPLFLRADVRAKRNDFAGAQRDREAAYAANTADSEQKKLVDAMWAPLETKYPGYGEFLRPGEPKPAESAEKERPGQGDAQTELQTTTPVSRPQE